MTEPVSLEDAKEHLRISPSETGEDSYIAGLVISARILCEKETKRAIVSKSSVKVLDSFPMLPRDLTLPNAYDRRSLDIMLGGGEVSSVDAVEYYDTTGANVTLDPASYAVDLGSSPARISPLSQWPSVADRAGAVRVSFTLAGMSGDDLALAAQAVKLVIESWYSQRGNDGPQTMQELPLGITRVLRPLIQMART